MRHADRELGRREMTAPCASYAAFHPTQHQAIRECGFDLAWRAAVAGDRAATATMAGHVVAASEAGDEDRRIAIAKGEEIHALVPGAKMLRIGGGGHVTAARDPVVFVRALREFIGGAAPERRWTRAMKRPRRALFLSSPIGLGHVQRDLAIARELRTLQPDLAIDWFTVDPAARYLEREGERLHPATRRLANESRHFERVAGEHDLQAFFALRTMDEIMSRNFMTFLDVVDAEHYDLVIGDEAWDVDYHYHENPELKRQPYVFLTDFVGYLPMAGSTFDEAATEALVAGGVTDFRAGLPFTGEKAADLELAGNLVAEFRKRFR